MKPKDIAYIRVGVGKNALLALTEPTERKYRPTNRVDAQFSLPYAAAVSIHRRKAFIKEYSLETYMDKEILNTANKVSYFLDEETEKLWPKCYAAYVEIETIMGDRFMHRTNYPKGDPENPLTKKEIVEKFMNLMEYGGYGYVAKKTIQHIEHFEQISKLDEMMRLLE